jgi:hypothetical protein
MRVGAFEIESQPRLWIDQRNRTAKRNQVEVRRPARRDRLEQSVVGVRIHLAETIVRQTLGVVADAARIASFVAVVGMAGNRHGCFGDRRLEAELEGFRNALISAARSRVRDSIWFACAGG